MKINHIKSALLLVGFSFFPGVGFSVMMQKPIQTGGSVVPPNLMFTLDDSGSMRWECLPDSLCSGSKDVGTIPAQSSRTNRDGVAIYDDVDVTADEVVYERVCVRWRYGECREWDDQPTGEIRTTVLRAAAPNLFSRKMRSGWNPLYYDPNTRYRPWLKEDGVTRYANSTPSAAPVSPGSTETQNLEGVRKIEEVWCTGTGSSACYGSSGVYQNVRIAQYYIKNPSQDGSQTSHYTKFTISSDQTFPTKGVNRTDCAGSTCTYAEEIQNFANWFTYYRSRALVAIAGTAEAFAAVPVSYRVGYGRINDATTTSIDGVDAKTLARGVRPFSGADKTAFYTWLFARAEPSGNTPLRRAMDDVGQYFSRTDNKGPWGAVPGTEDTTSHSACRRSFHILMTDGMWNSTAASVATGNVDNAAGETITGPNSQSYIYNPGNPYSDSNSDTLADVAMYYWKKDLRPDLANAVTPVTKVGYENPAFWQHMVNYTIAFGVEGSLQNPEDLAALKAGTKSWPNPGSGGSATIDDLWHAAVNSRGRSLSARSSAEYATALTSIIDEIGLVNGSEAGVAVSQKTISTASSTKKYEPTFSSSAWSGDVRAININQNGAETGVAWSAASAMPTPNNRNIFTYNASATTKGVAFEWANLSDSMKTSLYGATTGGEGLVSYLRGNAVGEGTTYRSRSKSTGAGAPLGDIVNSTPVLVGSLLDMQYEFLGNAASRSYRRHLAAKKLRQAQLFVGANDGMLHAFADDNGQETFAFVPSSLMGNLKQLSLPDYSHRYYVDGPFAEADVYDATNSKWRNLVVGGSGAGAKNLFAINVPVPFWANDSSTPPAALSKSQSAPGATDILWEINSSSTGFGELGHVLNRPEHGFMKVAADQTAWVVIVGNGYESTSGTARLFIINALTGALIKEINTGVGSPTSPNGLGGVRVVRDEDMRIVAAYAGDLQGNMWKFDFSYADKTDWRVAFNGNPLYQAVNASSQAEPITVAPTFVRHPLGGIMVLFGTGQLHAEGDVGNTQVRGIYGIWDKIKIGNVSSVATDRVTSATTIVTQTVGTAALTGTTGGEFWRLNVTPVDYATKRGWRIPLQMQSRQRVIDDPELILGRMLVQAVTPTESVDSCLAASAYRYMFSLDPFMSGTGTQPTFDTNGDGSLTVSDNPNALVVKLEGEGPATTVRVQGKDDGLILGTGDKVRKFKGEPNTARRYWNRIVVAPQ